MDRNPFTEAEIAGRLSKVRTELGRRDLEAAVFASPENVFYLTGLDHWGYFAPHLLIVPLDGEPILVTRSMEKVTIENQVKAASSAVIPMARARLTWPLASFRTWAYRQADRPGILDIRAEPWPRLTLAGAG